jgi:hypothetical protein
VCHGDDLPVRPGVTLVVCEAGTGHNA